MEMSDVFIRCPHCGDLLEDGFLTIVRLRFWCSSCKQFIFDNDAIEEIAEYFKGGEDEKKN